MTPSPSRRRRRGGWWLPLILVGGLGLASCTSGSEADGPTLSTPSTTSPTPTSSPTATAAPKPTYPISGLVAASVADTRRPAVAVPIRAGGGTIRGLSGADLVYVTFPDSGPARAIGVFQSAASGTVGPVSDTRPIDAKVLPVTSAGLVYAGGPSGYLKRLHTIGIPQLSRLDSSSSFSGSSTAPYISLSRARLMKHLGAPRAGLINIDPTVRPRTTAKTVTISVRQHAAIRLTWSPSARLWRGSVAGVPLTARNVVIQSVHYSQDVVPHSGQQVEGNPDVFGSGAAVSLPAGNVFSGGSWNRNGAHAVTGFVDSAKRAVAFAPGSTWVILVPLGTRVTG
jgi:hypothetical protein